MTASPDLEFQVALYEALTAALTPTKVEAHPPHDKALPFLQIGESIVTEHPAGHEIVVTIHAWSDAEGAHETKQLQQKVRDTFHAAHWIGTDWRFLPIRDFESRVFLDVDNETWHGVQRLRALAVPIAI